MLPTNNLEPICYALEDVDGTLTDSKGKFHGAVIAEGIQRISLEPKELITPEIAQAAYNGPGHGVDYFELLYNNLFVPYFESPIEALRAFRKKLPEVARELKNASFFEEEIKPLPGALESLQMLEARGIEVAAVTMTPGYLAEAILHRAGLLKQKTPQRRYIKRIYGCELYSPEESLDPELDRYFKGFRDVVKGLKKQDPELWKRTLGYTFDDLNLSRCMVAEDGSQGIQGAATLKVGLLVVLKQSNLLDTQISPETTLLTAKEDGNWNTLQ